MTQLDRVLSPAEPSGAQAVSKEDVGHGIGSSSRNDGYARRTKAKTSKSKHERNTRKTDTGEISDEADSAEDDENADEDDESNTMDEDATDEDDPDGPAPFDGISTNSQSHILSGLANTASSEAVTHQTGLSNAAEVNANTANIKRKRTFSEVTSETILNTIEQDPDDAVYPRKRVHRRLSNTDNGLLKYDPVPAIDIDEDIDLEDYAKAIESSSEEEEEDEDVAYDGISQVDDEDEEDLEKLEEAMIIQEETSKLTTNAADLNVFSAFDDAMDSDLELPSDIDLGPLNSEMDDIFSAGESFFFQGLSDDEVPARKKSDASARKVRFQDEVDIAQDSSEEESSDTDIDIFPDLMNTTFKSQDDLPATLRTQIEDDNDDDVAEIASSDGEGSVWDFGEEKASKNFFAWHDDNETESEDDNVSSSSLSGYDSMHRRALLIVSDLLTLAPSGW